jgi:hypothetical protein
LAAIIWLLAPVFVRFFTGWAARDIVTLATLTAVGGAFYAGVVLTIFGRRWLAAFRGRARG